MKRLRHVPLWASTAAVLAFVSFPQWSPLVVAASSDTASAEGSELPVLKGSLKPLIEDFNANKDKPRVLALLSPT